MNIVETNSYERKGSLEGCSGGLGRCWRWNYGGGAGITFSFTKSEAWCHGPWSQGCYDGRTRQRSWERWFRKVICPEVISFLINRKNDVWIYDTIDQKFEELKFQSDLPQISRHSLVTVDGKVIRFTSLHVLKGRFSPSSAFCKIKPSWMMYFSLILVHILFTFVSAHFRWIDLDQNWDTRRSSSS